jgi:RNA polymerase sigma-70 factor, ECF subfamily
MERCLEQTPRLLRLARRLMHYNEDEVQDLVQETQVRTFEAFLKGEYRDEGNLGAYQMRILINYFLSSRRRDRRSAKVDLETLLEGNVFGVSASLNNNTSGSYNKGADYDLLQQTLDESLEKALAALPIGLRAAILLVDIEGLEYSDAALALDIPIGTVRSRLFRARKLLYESLLPRAETQGWLQATEVISKL